jgi:hypothetical protein
LALQDGRNDKPRAAIDDLRQAHRRRCFLGGQFGTDAIDIGESKIDFISALGRVNDVVGAGVQVQSLRRGRFTGA